MIHAIEVLIGERAFNRRNPTWTMQTYGHYYGLNPDTSPYVQAILEADGSLIVELSGNIICEPPITESQMEQLEWVGWERPVDGDANSPNFVREFAPGWHPRFVAERIVESLTSIMRIQEDDFFNFSENPETIVKIAQIEGLNRLKPDPERNPNGSIFCLAGQHDDLTAAEEEQSIAETLRERLHPDFHVESTLLNPNLVVIDTDCGEVFMQVFPWNGGDFAVNVYTCMSHNTQEMKKFAHDLAGGYRDDAIDLDPLVGRWSGGRDGRIWFNVHLPVKAAQVADVLDETVRYIVDTSLNTKTAVVNRYAGTMAQIF